MTRISAAELYAKGSAAWPQIHVEPAIFEAYLSERCSVLEGLLLDDVRAADLFIACACVHDAPGAVAGFLQEYRRAVADAARRVDPSPSFADELTQNLSDTLFVGTNGAAPKISKYSGKGPLSAWVTVTAKRMALHLRSRRPHFAESSVEGDLIELAVLGSDPDLEYLKSRYAAELKEALIAAFQSLEPRLKVVLRLSFADGVSEKAIGAIYGVHQATISRWKTEAERHVLDRMKKILCEKHQLGEPEASSLIRALQSQIDINISRVLASEHAAGSAVGSAGETS
jgi:RNA polymerase sigma-70 factor (ECF subfamily)